MSHPTNWPERRGERRRWDARRERDLEFAHERGDRGGTYEDDRFADLDQQHDYGGYIEDDERSRSRFAPEYEDDSRRRADSLRRRGFNPYPPFGGPRAMAGHSAADRDRDVFGRDYRPAAFPSGRSDGPHRGRGPRNYQRSDERIREDICDQLTDAEFLDASDIDVTVAGGDVTLVGTVDARGGKRYAEDIAEAISGVRNVRNELRVRYSTGTNEMQPDTNAARTIGERHDSVKQR